MALQLRLFGRLEVRAVPGAVALNARLRPRAQRLLAYLLLHKDAALPRESIAFNLWPDRPEDESLGALRRALSDLRAALPAEREWILGAGGQLRWNPDAPFWLDIAEFERLTHEASQQSLDAAVAVYTGDVLADWGDEWVLVERERLSQLLAEALERLIALLEAERDYRSAIRQAQRLLRHDPLREETYRQLMRLYAWTGDRTGVRRVYQICAEVLRRELDAEVSPATRRAFEQRTLVEASPAPPVARTPTHNLPASLTAFIGRDQEMASVKEALRRSRLVTLTGPGGCGKTRLALEVAGDLTRGIEDGAWLVELGSLSDPALVPQAVAATLNVREQAGHPLPETLAASLQSKELLLVLDNCEHLLAACAPLAESLLRLCPGVRILATSRERLNVPGETVWPVPPLSLPTHRKDDLQQSEAVRLFVDRAASVLPTFGLSQQNAAAVAEICRRLDGIPLAIELTAARVRMLTAPEIAARLDDMLRLMGGGSPVAPPRHQTLRAAMDWSHALLSGEEQALFRRLAVFAGGWTLTAAEAVCAEKDESDAIPTILRPSEVLDVLSQLIDKSLVAADVQEGEARYRMLELVRQYARDRLLEAGETEQVRASHFQFFLAFAEAAEPGLQGPEQVPWITRMEMEHDNLRAALRYALHNERDESGLRLVVALSSFWGLRDYFTEGRDCLEQALARAPKPGQARLRARALNALMNCRRALGDYSGARSAAEQSLALFHELGDLSGIADTLDTLGIMAWHQSDYAEAQSLLEQCVSVSREAGYRLGMADGLHHLGHVALDQGHLEQATHLFRDSLALYREIGNRLHEATLLGDLGLAAYLREDYAAARSLAEEDLALQREMASKHRVAEALNRLGDLARCEGDDAQAEARYAESLAIFRQIGVKPFMAGTLHNLGYIALHRGEAVLAAARFQESLGHLRDIGDRKGIAECLMGLAAVASAQGQAQQAARLFGASEALREAVGATLWPANRLEYERGLAALRTQLAPDALAAAWAEGRAMPLEQAMDEALSGPVA